MKTAKIPVSQLTPDMIVADSVYTFNNQLIIQEGTRLSDKIITRLKFYSIDLIRILVEETEHTRAPYTDRLLFVESAQRATPRQFQRLMRAGALRSRRSPKFVSAIEWHAMR
jgi:hypothetical protein